MRLEDEAGLLDLIHSEIRKELKGLGLVKVTIDPAYSGTGNPKVQRPGESAPGGSDDTKKVFRSYGRARPTASSSAIAGQVGSDIALFGEIGDVPATTSELFGDGSDGDVTVSGTTTLTRDMFYRSLTVTGTLNTAGFRIFCQTFVLVSGSGVIQNNGANGNAGGGGGAGGTAGYFRGGAAGGAGGNLAVGTAGTAVGAPTGGGAGGTGGTGGANAGGAGGAVTAGESHWRHNPVQAAVAPFQLSSPSAGSVTVVGGGGGGGGGGSDSGQAGGAGGGGGVVPIYADSITVGASASIKANGGNGAGSPLGGGGGGGVVLLVYRSYSNSGTVQASGGTGNASGSAGSVITIPINV